MKNWMNNYLYIETTIARDTSLVKSY